MVGRYRPISDYGVIGDMHSAALVSVDGSIDWCCFPRFDSPSVFGALLDARKGGKFRLAPKGEFRASQSYQKDTNVLETLFETPTGSVRLVDFMPYFLHNGQTRAPHQIVRVVEQLRGQVGMKIEYDPRFNYGSGETLLTAMHEGCHARNGDAALTLLSNVALHLPGDHGPLVDEFGLPSPGEKAFFVVTFDGKKTGRMRVDDLEGKLAHTVRFWRSWVSHIKYEGLWRDSVVRSALVLKLLQYKPTGAIVAAVTTSLPETIGGERNWDYRYSWIRDAAFSLWALDSIGATKEAIDYTRWLLKLKKKSKKELQIMMGVGGESDLEERILGHLEGYEGSSPVRTGNAAYSQLQLDIYGALIDSMYFLHRTVGWTTTPIYEQLVRECANFVVDAWKKPDSGFWEMRTEPKFFVESRVWCFVALDRAIRLADELGFDEDIVKWKPVAAQIREEILSKGWSEEKRAFTMEYGGKGLDAANLLLPLLYFLPAKDRRVSSTIRRIVKDLSEGDFLRRYETDDDGLEGKEGTFTVCSFWLVDCLIRLHRLKEAKRLLEKLLSHANHLGLYSEEIDPKTGRALGNFPQAYTHMGLISAVVRFDRAVGISGREGKVGGAPEKRRPHP